MKRKNRAPDHIGSVLESLSVSMGKRELYDFAAICGNWRGIVGHALAEVSSPARLARKSLTIEVAQPVWADSMGYMKNEIIEKVNSTLGRRMVSRIRMIVRKGSGKGLGAEENGPTNRPPLPQSAVREAEEAVKYIDDSQLRSTFKRIILKDVSLKYYLNDKKKNP
ncbi:MAG: DUF721 domain-containing protein [Nitrospinota bacterium]|nr:DUF721 domain-containing protein [Nitrospinota bacterium]